MSTARAKSTGKKTMGKNHKKPVTRRQPEAQTTYGEFEMLPAEGTHYGALPVHPNPSIYETTLAEVTETIDGEPVSRFVDHVVIDEYIGPHDRGH